MINLSWNGYKSGQIPASALTTFDSTGRLLRPDVAAQFNLLVADMRADLGKTISMGAAVDAAYRSLAQQNTEYNAFRARGWKPPVAAIPGTSNHGYGRAADIADYGSGTWVTGLKYVNTDSRWQWLLANAAKYGFTWTTGLASGESWHWEYTLTPTISPASSGSTPIEEDDMPLTQADLNLLLNYPAYTGGPTVSEVLKNAQQVYNGMFVGGPSMADGEKPLQQTVADIKKTVQQEVTRSAAAQPTALPATGNAVISQIQDNADTNTIARRIAAKLGI